MFEEVAAVVDGLVAPGDGDGLVDLLRVRDRFECRVVESVGAFAESRAWDEAEGCASVAGWLRVRAGLSDREAHRLARLARRLRALPVLAGAWRGGEVSGGQVAAVCANLTDRTAALFAQHEEALVPVLAGIDVTDTARVMREWAVRAKAEVDDDGAEPDPDRAATLAPTLDGHGRLTADLAPDAHQAVRAALKLAMGRKGAGDERTPAQRRHDALAAVCTHYLDHADTYGGARYRPHVNVTLPLDALVAGREGGTTLEGEPVSPAEARRLACDAEVHRVITRADGSVLDYGRATRTVVAALFVVLCLRDKGCRFPGCDRPCSMTDAHHVRHWVDGGPTRPDNLVLLCRWHHQVVHRPGWSIALAPDGTVEVRSPDGLTRRCRPPRELPDLSTVAA